MVLHRPRPIESGPLELQDVPVPAPREGELLVRVHVCGVCHTDLHVVQGEIPLPCLPLIPGHQIVGTVEHAVASGRFAAGDRAGIAWLRWTCGACEFCESGRENLCRRALFTGRDVNGGYAEYVTVPEPYAYRLPAGFADEQAAPLLCAGIIGYRSLRISGIQPGQRLGLYGFGASASIAIQVARHWGCEVFVFTRSESHRQSARELGAAWVGGAQDDPPAKVHASVIFAPAGSLVPDALRALERGGTVALAGIHMSEIPPLDYSAHLYHERAVRSVANATRQDGEELLALATQIPLVTRVQAFALGEANDALRALCESQTAGAIVLRISRNLHRS